MVQMNLFTREIESQILDKGAKITKWGKTVFSLLGKQDIHMPKHELGFLPYTIHKN